MMRYVIGMKCAFLYTISLYLFACLRRINWALKEEMTSFFNTECEKVRTVINHVARNIYVRTDEFIDRNFDAS